MKKIFWVAFIFLIASSVSFAQNTIGFFGKNKQTNFGFEIVKGNVRSVRTIPYVAEMDGDLVKKSEIYHGDSPLYKNTLNVFEKGLLTEYRTYFSCGDLKEYIQHSYNDKGVVQETIIYDRYENPCYIRTHTSDDQGRVIHTKVCAASEDYCIVDIYYDFSTPYLKEISVESDSGEAKESFSVFYDKNGNVTSEEKRDSYGSRIYLHKFSYDKNNNLIEKTTEDGKITYKYNANNDCIEERGNISRKNYRKTFEYTYDQHNNWTQKVEYIDGKPSIITEREIIYY